MSKRRSKCKCGKIIAWDDEKNNLIICKHCKTTYRIDGDSVMIYWLEELVEILPHKTGMKI